MKRKWKIGLAALCVLTIGTASFAAAAGNEADPLITLSYLKNIFTGQVQEMIDASVAEGQEKVKGELDQAIQDWDARVSQAVEDVLAESGSSQTAAVYETVTLTKGQILEGQAGCELILRSGEAVLSAADPALTDTTTATTLAKGGRLAANHLYLVAGSCSVSVAVPDATGVVNAGPLNVRSGPGSSHNILGRLEQGTAVVILGSENGWYQITGGGLSGYVLSTYVTPDAVREPAPVVLLVRGAYEVR